MAKTRQYIYSIIAAVIFPMLASAQNVSPMATFTDENGDSTEMQGGGIAMDGDGAERPLTEDEIMEQINQPDVEYEDDGSVWLYYKDQKLDITDRFKDGICYVKLTDGEETLYLTVKYENGYAVSKSKYISPQEFN